MTKEFSESMLIKTPWLAPALPLAGAIFGLIALATAIKKGDASAIMFILPLTLILLIGSRIAASPRLAITPETLNYPRHWTTMKWRQIPWADILDAEFTLQSGFRWPVLIVTTRNQQKPLGIPFPMVNVERRKQALDLIHNHLRAAKQSSGKRVEPPLGNGKQSERIKS